MDDTIPESIYGSILPGIRVILYAWYENLLPGMIVLYDIDDIRSEYRHIVRLSCWKRRLGIYMNIS